MKNKLAFTLIEVLLVLATIGLITALATVAYNQTRSKSRDHKRTSDIILLQQILESYHRQEGSYPSTLTPGQPLVGSSGVTYLVSVPEPPTPADGNCATSTYSYQTTNDNQDYGLEFCLGSKVSSLASGINCATQNDIASGACSACGDSISYGGESYPTVLIGNQCWMAKNLNVGTMVTGVTGQTDNSILEKYCYNNDVSSECATYGGLYQWDEAMQYSVAEGAQGICPSGWHIPTDAEQYALESYLTDSPNTCDGGRTDWDCIDASTKLQTGGTSHFESLLSGYRGINGTFISLETDTLFWSSTISGSDAWDRHLLTGSTTVYRFDDNRAAGISVRCLKDTNTPPLPQ